MLLLGNVSTHRQRLGLGQPQLLYHLTKSKPVRESIACILSRPLRRGYRYPKLVLSCHVSTVVEDVSKICWESFGESLGESRERLGKH